MSRAFKVRARAGTWGLLRGLGHNTLTEGDIAIPRHRKIMEAIRLDLNDRVAEREALLPRFNRTYTTKNAVEPDTSLDDGYDYVVHRPLKSSPSDPDVIIVAIHDVFRVNDVGDSD